jgi:hypothetical protein
VKLVDEHTFAAAGVEHAGAGRERRQIGAHAFEFGEIGRVELPVRREFAVVVAPFCVFARP